MKKIYPSNSLFKNKIFLFKNNIMVPLLPTFLKKKLLSKIFKHRLNKQLDWNNLTTYNEKIQYYKLYHLKNMSNYVDKLKVRDYVKEKIGEEYLIPLLGYWEKPEQINFEKLPNQFVIKTNHGTKTNIIVNNRSYINKTSTIDLLNYWLKINFAYINGLELQYNNVKPVVIAEKFLNDTNGELNDYKFICFNGKPYYCWIDINRDASNQFRNIYDLNWNLQNWSRGGIPSSEKHIEPPKNFEKMIEIATKLSTDFSHVRVDLYNVDGTIYFGELTFSSGSGFSKMDPEEYDFLIGKLWNL